MITVRQLIEKLQALPDEQKDLPVVTWGCSYESEREALAGEFSLMGCDVWDPDAPLGSDPIQDYLFLE